MRIQKLSQLTGLSKKAIYYYIDEGLVKPSSILENGYYDFAEADLNSLKIIAVLRQLDMPISMIKEVFAHPPFMNYFLHSHFNNLRKELNILIQNLDLTSDLIQNLPPNANPEDLINEFSLIKSSTINSPIIEHLFENNDARMIAILIWGSFLNIPATEYHKYLWNKISIEFKNQGDINLTYLSKLIYALDSSKLAKIVNKQFVLSNQITDEFSELSCTNMIIVAIKDLISDEKLIEYWILTYDKLLKPMFEFCNGNAHALMLEYNERYKKYMSILNTCTSEIISNPKYDELLTKLKTALHYKIDIEHFDHFELSFILTFKNSLYTNLDINALKDLLEK